MRQKRIWRNALINCAILAVVIGFGLWFNDHYSLVQRDDVSTLSPVSLPERLDIPVTPAAAVGLRQGPFSYTFHKGDERVYTIQAAINGKGIDMGESSPIKMDFVADTSLRTLSVDSAGNGELRLEWRNVQMKGDFMSNPFDLTRTPGRTIMTIGGQTKYDSAQGGAAPSGLPQIEFFDKPITMRVSPEGEVLSVEGPPGMDKLVKQGSVLSPVQFTDPEIPIHAEWESTFMLPVPGFMSSPTAQVKNTLTGYETINGRKCGVVSQQLSSRQKDGQAASPAGAMGKENMTFTMPEFRLEGNNRVYFDVDNGELVHADLDLVCGLQLGQEMQPIGQILGFMQDMLKEVENGPNSGPSNPAGSGANPLLDLGMNIAGSMHLRE